MQLLLNKLMIFKTYNSQKKKKINIEIIDEEETERELTKEK